MTSVIGHLNELRFPAEYKDWRSPPPSSLFDAPVEDVVYEVRFPSSVYDRSSNECRTKKLLQKTSHNKPDTLELFSSGRIAIERVSISVQRFEERPFRATGRWKLKERSSATLRERMSTYA